MNHDRYGLALSTASSRAAELYREGIDLLLSAWPGAAEHFDAAITTDPGFALAHIARGRVHQAYAEVAAARDKANLARSLAEDATAREKGHIAALAASIEGRSADAIRLAEDHLEAFPRDAVVLSLLMGAFGHYAFSGRADHDQARVAICERHARHYGSDWWFMTYLGWSHAMAPVIMGNPERPDLHAVLDAAFCRTDPACARVFARTTFLSDNRSDLAKVGVATLIIECADDVIAPRTVGAYVHEQIPDSRLITLDALGHCPHVSDPDATATAIAAFAAPARP